MQAYIWWFLLAIGLIGLEIMTGTFYILVFSIAFSAGGLMAYWQYSFTIQLVVAALFGVIGTVLLRSWKAAQERQHPQDHQNLDIGQPVTIETWNPNGSARVIYRGTQWDGELVSPDTPRDKPLYIKDRRGSILILTHHEPRDGRGRALPGTGADKPG